MMTLQHKIAPTFLATLAEGKDVDPEKAAGV
jgi:hypothetical protein